MIRPRTAIVLGVAPFVLLAACGGQTDTAQTATNTAATPDVDYVQQIRTMPEGQRTAVFLRAIRDAGRACQQVTQVTEVTGQGGPATWSATCGNGSRWIVAIGPTGTATVTNQAELRQAQNG